MKTIRVYVDGAPTPAVTGTDDASERLALPVNLSPGAHTVAVTAQADGETESAPTVQTVTVGPYEMPGAPYAVEGATLAKAITLRAILRMRKATGFGFGETVIAGDIYDNGATWFNDFTHTIQPFQPYFSWQFARSLLDQFASYIGTFVQPGTGKGYASVPQSIYLDGSLAYWGFGSPTWKPDISKAADLAFLVAYCHRMGDPTAWSTYKTVCENALHAFDTAEINGGKTIYSDSATQDPNMYYWWDESTSVIGYVATATADHCRAWLMMKEIATSLGDSTSAAAYQAEVDAYIPGLRSLRITSGDYAGFYKPYSGDAVPHVPTTAYVVAYGLCDATERATSASALVTMYLAGRISRCSTSAVGRGGYWRNLVNPTNWASQGAHPVGTHQNGGFWATEAIGPAIARSFEIAGRSDLALEWTQHAVRELQYQHRYSRSGPWEWIDNFGAAGPGILEQIDSEYNVLEYRCGYLQTFEGTWLSHATEGLPSSIDITVSGANGSEATLALPNGHMIRGFDVIAGQAANITVELLGNEPGWVGDDDHPNRIGAVANSIYVPMGSVTLAGTATGRTDSVAPIAAYGGGGVKAKVVSGSTAGSITVRLDMSPRVPSLVPAALPPADEFLDDTSADYRFLGDASWVFGGGVATQSGTAAAHALLRAVPPVPDVHAKARLTPAASRSGRIYLRWRDAQNWLAVDVRAAGVYFVKCAAGAETTLASQAVTISTSTPSTVEARLSWRSVASTRHGAPRRVSTLDVWVNDVLRLTTTDPVEVHAGLVGFGAGAGTGSVTFDRFEVLSRTHYVAPGFVLEVGRPTGYTHDDLDTAALAALGSKTFVLRSADGAELRSAQGTSLVTD